ncbi:Protein gir2 [Malassezia cuniculi]|uniref:Protein gir2 n=1 Tax=Malassezia cuniculi TaxID=948313 RepID=A0AAF0J558_9BASI|nr:Protein gir2 [Malassezia cuniculi]
MVSADEHAQTLAEELEVLESIYIDELEKISDDYLRISVVPEEQGEVAEDSSLLKAPPTLVLHVKYTQDYPDEVPQIAITVRSDEAGVFGGEPDVVSDDAPEDIPESNPHAGIQELLAGVHDTANESLGMPMVFTLASHLRETLTEYISRKDREAQAEASRRRDAELEAEAEKFRGTAVTVERFNAWRKEFEREREEKRAREEAAYIASLSAKEREEYRRFKSKPSGRQLFSKEVPVEEEEKGDDSVKDVDWSQFSREEREKHAREDLDQVEESVSALDLDDSDDD